MLALALLACGNAKPPPPAHLDPEYADAGPPILLHEPWPQTGPFYCHAVTAADGARTSVCARTRKNCEIWRDDNRRKGYRVEACATALEASCLSEQQRELCFATLEECQEVREAMGATAACRTIRAVWKPE